jgi:hypothetical protein
LVETWPRSTLAVGAAGAADPQAVAPATTRASEAAAANRRPRVLPRIVVSVIQVPLSSGPAMATESTWVNSGGANTANHLANEGDQARIRIMATVT